jgi:hypothetical protein
MGSYYTVNEGGEQVFIPWGGITMSGSSSLEVVRADEIKNAGLPEDIGGIAWLGKEDFDLRKSGKGSDFNISDETYEAIVKNSAGLEISYVEMGNNAVGAGEFLGIK